MKNKIEINKNEKIVIASHNKGKVKEIKDLLEPLSLKTISVSKFSIIEPKENGTNFKENALIKARSAHKLSGLNSLSDDSGLCIEALEGQPGIFSARWAGKEKNFSKAMNTIKKKLKNKTNTNAYFICALALITKDKKEFCFTGKIHGYISFPAKGHNGFGYDPIFIPKNFSKTFGEMLPSQKKLISHRTLAFNKFKESIFVK